MYKQLYNNSTHNYTSKLYSYVRLFRINPLFHVCNVGILRYFPREFLNPN